MPQDSKSRNAAIDVFRYICAILVIAIHTNPGNDFGGTLGFILNDMIPRIAVPFFFITAGYYYIRKLENGEAPFFPYIKRILITYSLWSTVYFAVMFIHGGYADLKVFAVNSVINYLYYGSYYHFWFFPALIFAVCFTTLIWKLGIKKAILPISIAAYLIGCIGCAYYSIGVRIPVLGTLFSSESFMGIRRMFLMGFPFFASGYAVLLIEKKKDELKMNALVPAWIVSFIIWLAEIVVVVKLGLYNNIVITAGLYLLTAATLLLLLHTDLRIKPAIASKTRLLANFTYYSHPLFLIPLRRALSGWIGLEKNCLAAFIGTALLTFAVGMILIKINNKHLNKLMS